MTPERQKVGISKRFKDDIRGQLVVAGIKLAAPAITMSAENIVRHIPTEYEEGFDERIEEMTAKGKRFLLVPNHQSLADTVTYFNAADRIRKTANFPGYFLIYTKTLATGDKGADQKGLQDVFASELPKHEITRVFLARDSDRERFHTKANLKEVYGEIKSHLKEGLGGIIHAEGNLNASRPKGVTEPPTRSGLDGLTTIFRSESDRLSIERNGMQRFERNALRSIIDIADGLGIEMAVVPVAVSRTYNIHDPSTGGVTRSALRVGLGLSDTGLASVFILNPMDVDEGELGEIRKRHKRMTPQDWDDFNTVIARRIAGRLPEKMRGIYGQLEQITPPASEPVRAA